MLLAAACVATSAVVGAEPPAATIIQPDSRQLGEPEPTQAFWAEPDAQEELPRREPASGSRRPRGGTPGTERSPVRIATTWMPGRQVQGQARDLALGGVRANLALPIRIAPDGRWIWLATSGFEYLRIDTDAILPDSQLAVPGELWKLDFGTMHLREFDNGWSAGGLFTVGTASDRPFADLRDLTLTSLAFLNVPSGPRDAWNFSLFYSPTSQLPFPLPGAAYVWRPSESFTAHLGVPFSLRYRPTEAWTLTADYRPLTAVDVRVSRALGNEWSLYARFQIENETYWLAERTNSKDRLYVFDQRAGLGFERKLPAGFGLDVSAAYVFDRSLFQAESFSAERSDVLNIAPGAGVSLSLRWSR
ncbi:MAG: hypothetical protein JNL96_03375 [Planctomycetaceae bacterium]|nr:hypothetical protein [Planctomycetaceae bacterium]